MLELIKGNYLYTNLATSLIVVIIVLVARVFATRSIREWDGLSPEVRRRWLVQIKNASLFLLLFGLLLVWATELKTFAVSLVALAAAIVIATKELILCFTGGILKASSRLFNIGDRIEVGIYRGDVVSHNLMTTTLNEIGPGKDHHQFTGRIVILPNAILLNTAVINESTTGRYVLHVFKVPMKKTENWQHAIDLLTQISKDQCQDYIDEAKREFSANAKRQIIESPTIDPRIHVALTEPEKLDLIVRVPAPNNRKGKVEQAILQEFLKQWHSIKGEPSANNGKT